MSDPVYSAILIERGDKTQNNTEVPCCRRPRQKLCKFLFVAFFLAALVKVACCIYQRQARMEWEAMAASSNNIRSGHSYESSLESKSKTDHKMSHHSHGGHHPYNGHHGHVKHGKHGHPGHHGKHNWQKHHDHDWHGKKHHHDPSEDPEDMSSSSSSSSSSDSEDHSSSSDSMDTSSSSDSEDHSSSSNSEDHSSSSDLDPLPPPTYEDREPTTVKKEEPHDIVGTDDDFITYYKYDEDGEPIDTETILVKDIIVDKVKPSQSAEANANEVDFIEEAIAEIKIEKFAREEKEEEAPIRRSLF
jgi:hypothetical protein